MGSQIDSPSLLIEGTRLDLPLGWLTLYANHPPVVAAGGGGSPQRLLQSLATETPGVPVLLSLRLLPPEYPRAQQQQLRHPGLPL